MANDASIADLVRKTANDAMGLPTWAGFGLVSLFLLVSAIVTGILTKKNASTIKGPDLSMAELRKTQETLAPSKPVE